jgi:hypothetical protein
MSYIFVFFIMKTQLRNQQRTCIQRSLDTLVGNILPTALMDPEPLTGQIHRISLHAIAIGGQVLIERNPMVYSIFNVKEKESSTR